MTADTSDAEDIVQETFLRAWQQLKRFDGRASFGTWLYRICANCSLDRVRRRKRIREIPVEPDEPWAELPHGGPSPERLAASGQIGALLGPAMEELSEMERAAFVMRHYDGRSIDEISKTLGVERGAAKHSVFRAVQKLRRALEPARSGVR